MKFKISPILRGIYYLVKGTVFVTFSIFYKKQYRINRDYFETPAPCIIVGNHPSTLVDVLIAAKEKHAIVHFLANAGLFSSKISNWVLSRLFCIKVERAKDVSGRRIDNVDSFRRSAEFLLRNGTLYVAAEGSSKLERRLRKIKTGTARIALDTAKISKWTIPLKILPVGLTYENPKKACYDLLYNFGQPIDVLSYKEQYQQDPVRAVKQLTRNIQERMQSLLLHTEPTDDDIDKLVQKLEIIHKNEYGTNLEEQFSLSKKWIVRLVDLKVNDLTAYNIIAAEINKYCDALVNYQLTDQAVQSKSNFLLKTFWQIAGFLPAVWGWLHNLLAFYLPDFIIRKTGMYHGYTSSIKLLLTVFVFPITYWIQYRLVGMLDLGPYIPLIYILSTILLGFFALFYFRKLVHYRARSRWNQLRRKDQQAYNQIKSQRKAIISNVFTNLIP